MAISPVQHRVQLLASYAALLCGLPDPKIGFRPELPQFSAPQRPVPNAGFVMSGMWCTCCQLAFVPDVGEMESGKKHRGMNKTWPASSIIPAL